MAVSEVREEVTDGGVRGQGGGHGWRCQTLEKRSWIAVSEVREEVMDGGVGAIDMITYALRSARSWWMAVSELSRISWIKVMSYRSRICYQLALHSINVLIEFMINGYAIVFQNMKYDIDWMLLSNCIDYMVRYMSIKVFKLMKGRRSDFSNSMRMLDYITTFYLIVCLFYLSTV